MAIVEPMKSASETAPQKRNKGFDETHQEVIEAAVGLISAKGVEALSMAAIARAVGINRTTLYYHFDDRDALLRAVKAWSSGQMMKALSHDLPQQDRIDHLTRFVLENPELIKLWIEDFVSGGDIRDSYPMWDTLVDGIRASLAAEFPDQAIDAEVYCVGLVTAAVIAPRVFRNSVRPGADIETVVRLFTAEHQRLLRHDALIKG